jgi:SAM-dependent methyltransferase
MHAHGAGPGPLTFDGCAVEVYAALPAEDEPRIIHEATPPGGAILELGAGTGRVTHPLLELGHPVTAVDASPEMLRRIRGGRTVCGRVEELDLGERFATVVLGSHLVNSADPADGAAMLATCRRHLAPGGRALIERLPPEFFDDPEAGASQKGPVELKLREVSLPEPGIVHATMHYRIGERHWTQTFSVRRFTADELPAAGLVLDRALTPDGRWLAAVADRES